MYVSELYRKAPQGCVGTADGFATPASSAAGGGFSGRGVGVAGGFHCGSSCCYCTAMLLHCCAVVLLCCCCAFALLLRFVDLLCVLMHFDMYVHLHLTYLS